jgi:rhodanese-related sulfurtransferase
MTPKWRPSAGKVAVDMVLIALSAAAIGIAWNHRLLYNTWTGKAPATAVPAPTAVPGPDIPLPLGLQQVKELFDRKEALFVDARDAGTFADGHIRDAVSLPAGSIDVRLRPFLASVPIATAIVVYCTGFDCHDSRDVGATLMKAGYRTVYIFEGGWPEWRDAGYPAARGAT